MRQVAYTALCPDCSWISAAPGPLPRHVDWVTGRICTGSGFVVEATDRSPVPASLLRDLHEFRRLPARA